METNLTLTFITRWTRQGVDAVDDWEDDNDADDEEFF